MATALRQQGEETDGGEIEVLGSLSTALQATVEVISAAAAAAAAEEEEEEGEREGRENRWRANVLRELMMSVMRDAARLVYILMCVNASSRYTCTYSDI